MFITVDSINHSLNTSKVDKSGSWFHWRGNYQHTAYVFLVSIWPSNLFRVLAFALIITTLDGLLIILERFLQYAQSMVAAHTTVMLPQRSFGNPYFQETRGHSLVEGTIASTHSIEVRRNLVNEFGRIKSLFSTYNELMRPFYL